MIRILIRRVAFHFTSDPLHQVCDHVHVDYFAAALCIRRFFFFYCSLIGIFFIVTKKRKSIYFNRNAFIY